jgi:hypothetical protein
VLTRCDGKIAKIDMKEALEFQRSKCFISISWKPIAYSVVQAPTRNKWLDNIWSSAWFKFWVKIE